MNRSDKNCASGALALGTRIYHLTRCLRTFQARCRDGLESTVFDCQETAAACAAVSDLTGRDRYLLVERISLNQATRASGSTLAGPELQNKLLADRIVLHIANLSSYSWLEYWGP
jgi:hypothetical protein